MSGQPLTFYEFFAGAGMARAGLGASWECLFANDFDAKKGRVYADNWGSGALRVGDVKQVQPEELPGIPDLVWASFPCQDLSLAGGGAGLQGDRSGTFWPFWTLMRSVMANGRRPATVVLENVCGALTSHDGADFVAICTALHGAGYRFGAVVVDAALFVPHSRPRLFFVAVDAGLHLPVGLTGTAPAGPWHSRALQTAYMKLPSEARRDWIWWRLPVPSPRSSSFVDLIEDDPTGVAWHTPSQTAQLLSMMSNVNRAKVEQAKRAGRRMVGGVYKRTRRDEGGVKVQRAEVRFDDVAGCLRTPAGGSSRQTIIVVDGDAVKSRLISTRETARLMGLPDSYRLPLNYNEGYHLTGDGVVVPVVRYLASKILEPVLHQQQSTREAA